MEWGYRVWSVDSPVKEWYGVSVNDEGLVTRINLCCNNLRGEILKEIGLLRKLKELHLTENFLSG